MALYNVQRSDVDNVQPGEFMMALVVAGGTALARDAVKHLLPGRKGVKVSAERIETNGRFGAALLTSMFDERDPGGSFLPEYTD